MAGSRLCHTRVVDGSVPTTREALAPYLDSLGIRPDAYNLFGAQVENAVVIAQRTEGWIVYYSERGGEWSPTVFESEAEACADLLAKLIQEEHNFFQLVVGPLPAAEADAAWAAWLEANLTSAEMLDGNDWKKDDVPWAPGSRWRRYFVRTTTIRSLAANH